MSFASQITRLPRAFDPQAGDEALGHVPDLTGEVAALVAGAAGCSPYLGALTETEAGWLPAALEDPEAALARTIAEARDHAEGVV